MNYGTNNQTKRRRKECSKNPTGSEPTLIDLSQCSESSETSSSEDEEAYEATIPEPRLDDTAVYSEPNRGCLAEHDSNSVAGRGRGLCFTAWTHKPNSKRWTMQYSTADIIKRMEQEPIGNSSTVPIWRYLVFQQETSPSTKQMHYQGYFYTNCSHRWTALSVWLDAVFGCHCWISFAKGSPKQNREYCTKSYTAIPGTMVERGVMPAQGKKTDMHDIADKILAGESMRTIAMEYPGQFIRYYKGFTNFQQTTMIIPRSSDVQPSVYWWFGPTGVGKSRLAFERYPGAYNKMMGCKWWDQYSGEKEIILDDYRPDLCTFSMFLKITDRHPLRVEGKGGSMHLSATVFVITTTCRPEVIWARQTDEHMDQLLRRITHIEEFMTDGHRRVWKEPGVDYLPLTGEALAQALPRSKPRADTFYQPY